MRGAAAPEGGDVSGARPMTRDETERCVKRSLFEIALHGIWGKFCRNCDAVVGARLGSEGEPTADDLALCACPHCGSAGAVARFVEGQEV